MDEVTSSISGISIDGVEDEGRGRILSAGQLKRSASVCGPYGLKSIMKMRSLDRVK